MTAPTAPVDTDTLEAVTAPAAAPAPAEEVVTQDLLVEDVSIDGMCGVY